MRYRINFPLSSGNLFILLYFLRSRIFFSFFEEKRNKKKIAEELKKNSRKKAICSLFSYQKLK